MCVRRSYRLHTRQILLQSRQRLIQNLHKNTIVIIIIVCFFTAQHHKALHTGARWLRLWIQSPNAWCWQPVGHRPVPGCHRASVTPALFLLLNQKTASWQQQRHLEIFLQHDLDQKSSSSITKLSDSWARVTRRLAKSCFVMTTLCVSTVPVLSFHW